MYSRRFRRCGYGKSECRLRKRFAASDGDTAARRNIEWQVWQDFVHNLIHRHFSATCRSVGGLLWLHGLGFRIVAPYAMERAPFEEDAGAQSWSIFHATTLYVEDNAFHNADHYTMFGNVAVPICLQQRQRVGGWETGKAGLRPD